MVEKSNQHHSGEFLPAIELDSKGRRLFVHREPLRDLSTAHLDESLVAYPFALPADHIDAVVVGRFDAKAIAHRNLAAERLAGADYD